MYSELNNDSDNQGQRSGTVMMTMMMIVGAKSMDFIGRYLIA